MTYFESFWAENILKEIEKLIGNQNIITNIYRIQTFDSIMCGYYCTEFTEFVLKGKSLLDYTNLFSPNDYEKNDNTKIFSILKRWKNYTALFVLSIKYMKNLKYHTSSTKTLVLSIVCSKCKNEDEKLFTEKESIEILKIVGLIQNI